MGCPPEAPAALAPPARSEPGTSQRDTGGSAATSGDTVPGMAKVSVYATPFCLYCVGAKRLLRRRGIAFDETRMSMFEQGARDRLQAQSGGGRTFPQIVIDGEPIGGFDSLRALDRSGELARRTASP
jgi:glutaredoxin 3